MTRRICIVTGTRAEYGLLRGVIERVREAPALELQLVVTGMHLAPEFGRTVREIEADGHPIAARIDMLLSSDTAGGITKSMGLGLIGFADTFERLKPDLLVILGDRFEIFVAAAAAAVAAVPIAHLHGGESTEGAFDEAFRHSITKMSHLHFVAAEPYRRRVIQLGESPDRVFLVGGLGIDAIEGVKLLDRGELEAALGFKFAASNLLITFHPVTLEGGSGPAQMTELLASLAPLQQTRLIFTMPNADTEGRELARMVAAFCDAHDNARCFASLGQRRYLSCLKQVDGVVGNSSSGLTEAPSFGIGTVNVGNRQAGRLKAASVIDCAPERASIGAAIATLLSAQFKRTAALTVAPYGVAGASRKIVDTLHRLSYEGLLKKRFHDLPSSEWSS